MINFIDPIDPGKERSCRLWVLISLVLVAAVVSIIGCIQIPQFMTFLSLRKEYVSIKNMLAHNRDDGAQDVLIREHDTLKHNIDVINDMHEKFNKRIHQLEAIHKACVNNVQLSSCTLSDKQISIDLVCSSIDVVNTVISALTQSRQFDDLLITSITPQKNGLQVVVKESVRNNLNSVK